MDMSLEEFISNLNNDFVKFKRGVMRTSTERSFFWLKAAGEILICKKPIYIYDYKDLDIDEGEVKQLYTEMSPEKLFEILSDKNGLYCFTNEYMDRKRASRIFSRNTGFCRYHVDDDDCVGNGYGGYIERNDKGSEALYSIKTDRSSFTQISQEVNNRLTGTTQGEGTTQGDNEEEPSI